MKYFVSIIIILIGMLMTIKSEWMLKAFGYNDWAENKFSSWGGSRTFYKLLGLVIIIVALLIMTGWAESILASIFSPVKNL